MKYVRLFGNEQIFQNLKDSLARPLVSLIKDTQMFYRSSSEKAPNIGDIVVYSLTEDKHIFINPSKFNGDEGLPIAIVVIPETISGSISESLRGKNVCISLANMDASNPKEGTADNLFEGTAPVFVGTYTSIKGVVTENTEINTGETYSLVKFDGWNGRSNYTATKRIDFEKNSIGDVVIDRYEVFSQNKTKFYTCGADAVSNKFNKVISVNNENGTVLIPAPSGSYKVKGYISLAFYNPRYTLESGDHYVGGFKDNTYPWHYWYNQCDENNEEKLRIPCPINSNNEFNKIWLNQTSMTSDFNGKQNTAELVAKAMDGVYDVAGGNLLKWDGTAKGLWSPYQVEKYTSVCKTGYDKDGIAYNLSQYNSASEAKKAEIKLYMFPSNYNNSGALMEKWNYAALTCHCFAPTGSGTHEGDWYCPAAGEAGFALAFADKINLAVDKLCSKGYKAVGLRRPVNLNESAWSNTYKDNSSELNPYFRGNENARDILLTSTAYDDNWMVDMYMGHASYYARKSNPASVTRAFILL